MVNSPGEWLWSIWHRMLGNVDSAEWLSTDALLKLFVNNRLDAIRADVVFVKDVLGKSVWNDLQNKMFLGDDDFVVKEQ